LSEIGSMSIICYIVFSLLISGMHGSCYGIWLVL